MDRKVFVSIFILITLVAIGVLSYSNLPDGSATPSPASSNDPAAFLFGNQNTRQENPQQLQQQQQQAQQKPPQKQIKQYPSFPAYPIDIKSKKAVIQTKKGNIEFELYPEATKAASNFVFLAKDGFYDGLTFHRVEKGFVIQGGDPFGNGTGGPGYRFEDEPVTRPYSKGIVAMANSGPDTNGSQFFIMLADYPQLPPKYTIFGKVTKGQEVVDSIAVGDVMEKVSISP